MVVPKATSLKDAISKYCSESEQTPAQIQNAKLYGMIPPIDKMDAALNQLVICEKLSLSTNTIDRITNLNGLKCLRILSLGRNNIKNLSGLDAVSDTLEQLWISYNLIEKLKGIQVLKKLLVLYMTNNMVKDWAEFQKLSDLPSLVELNFVGNPLEEKHASDGDWKDQALKRLPNLNKLDGDNIVKDMGDDDDDVENN
eukprot:TRINITY_DN1208_c1_g1_i1.p1 TRINITY_DN1208_c1_g1~~TRINITY_DN1208_c1_g1_i1.p1  ORF type:complete len:198 (-),score=29.05 TRINITY_DN1208_c1_g1_i1:147-740(-)